MMPVPSRLGLRTNTARFAAPHTWHSAGSSPGQDDLRLVALLLHRSAQGRHHVAEAAHLHRATRVLTFGHSSRAARCPVQAVCVRHRCGSRRHSRQSAGFCMAAGAPVPADASALPCRWAPFQPQCAPRAAAAPPSLHGMRPAGGARSAAAAVRPISRLPALGLGPTACHARAGPGRNCHAGHSAPELCTPQN